MLSELHVSDLGVIEELQVVLGGGMTALTGETGAGKTLVVEAIELLVGGRSDAALVRPPAEEAVVDGRFSAASGHGDDLVVRRALPASGRSRAYLDGRMASSAALAEVTAELVDLHGQHAHQSLLAPATQRSALDRVAAIDHAEVSAARARRREVLLAQQALGGDTRALARELDLLRHEVADLDGAALTDPDEDASLLGEEERLADAGRLRELAGATAELIAGDGGLNDRLGPAVTALAGRPALEPLHGRLRSLAVELADVAGDAQRLAEVLEDDPERLAEVGARRHQLRELRRRYGDTLGDVIAYREQARARMAALESSEARAEGLAGELRAADAALAAAEDRLGAARRQAAPRFAAEVQKRLRKLAMAHARFAVEVGDDRAGESVTWLLGANPGEPLLPLTKVASGGELAVVMLAARLVLSVADATRADAAERRTLVFDEVDAGIGGQAALAVGRALQDLARHHQVLVVTHLPQVAAFADTQIAVTKEVRAGRTVARAATLGREERIVELARMLSGQPDSPSARRHAAELLDQSRRATPSRGRREHAQAGVPRTVG